MAGKAKHVYLSPESEEHIAILKDRWGMSTMAEVIRRALELAISGKRRNT